MNPSWSDVVFSSELFLFCANTNDQIIFRLYNYFCFLYIIDLVVQVQKRAEAEQRLREESDIGEMKTKAG